MQFKFLTAFTFLFILGSCGTSQKNVCKPNFAYKVDTTVRIGDSSECPYRRIVPNLQSHF